jgi:hypothetical protein
VRRDLAACLAVSHWRTRAVTPSARRREDRGQLCAGGNSRSVRLLTATRSPGWAIVPERGIAVDHPNIFRWHPRLIAGLLSATLLLLAAPVNAAAPDAPGAPSTVPGDQLVSGVVEELNTGPCDSAPVAVYSDRDQARAEHLAGIDCATWRRIVEGFTVNDRLVYRPRVSVSRGELATFVAQTLIAAGYEHRLDDGAGTPEFLDIAGHANERRINQLARAGIVTGDAKARFQPDAAVHRDEVASALVRAYEWALEVDLTASGSHFTDVPASSVYAEDINAGYEQDLFTGSAPERFSPRRSVARDEMATLSVTLLRGVWTDDGLGVLAARARTLIAHVEASELPCATRTQIVRRLRILHDAIESGRRTAAHGLLIAWMHDARTSMGTGLLPPELGATLHSRMDQVLTQIGEGWPEHPRPTPLWQPLPNCDTGANLAASYNPEIADFDANDALILLQGLVGMVPTVGPMLASMTTLLWPDSGTDVSALIDSRVYDQTKIDLTNDLKGLRDQIDSIFIVTIKNWHLDCKKYGDDSDQCRNGALGTHTEWKTLYMLFTGARPHFQSNVEMSGKTYDDRVKLLPLFAQFETLYLAFLREGVLLQDDWMAAGIGSNEARTPQVEMAKELDPTRAAKDVGISYVDAMYAEGLAKLPEEYAKLPAQWGMGGETDWNRRNAYVRDMTIYVLDFRDTWRYMDPIAYPDGAPNIKLTRMIYSDIVGGVANWSDFKEPANVPGPLTELTIWGEKNAWYVSPTTEAVQATSPPSGGPAKAGRITGDATLDHKSGQPGPHIGFFDLRERGPITKVKTSLGEGPSIFYPSTFPASIELTFAATTETELLGYDTHADPNITDEHSCPKEFSFPGHVLATVEAIGTWAHLGSYGETVADSIIFGFRRADSFLPSASLIGVQSGKCIDIPASSNWTDGTQAQIYSCHGGTNQIWAYNTDTKELQAGGKCLTAGGTTAGSPAVIRGCTGALEQHDQHWEVDSNTAGTSGQFKSVQSGLVLDVAGGGTANGTKIVLYTPHTGTNQQWKLPDPREGQIRSIATGRCFSVKDKSTANGAIVHMWSCQQPGDTSVNERWTYNEATKTLSVYGGTKCLQATGTARGSGLVIWDCTGAPNQQWTMNADRTITGVQSGLVLDVDSGYTADGTKLQLWTKSSDLRNQQWTRPSQQGHALHALAAGKCLELPQWGNGTQAVIRNCSSLDAKQTLTYHPITQTYTLSTPSGPKCLDAAGGGTTAGTAVVINDCTPGVASQRWSRDVNHGTVANINSMQYGPDDRLASVMILGVSQGATADGAPVLLTPQPLDDDGNLLTPASSQQWVWPPG